MKENYNAFSDIEFNPKKSINCQAKALALYISLIKKGVLEEALKNKDFFLEIAYGYIKTKKETVKQKLLF